MLSQMSGCIQCCFLAVNEADGDRDLVAAMKNARRVHTHILNRRISIDSQLGATMIRYYTKLGDLDRAQTLFNNLRQQDNPRLQLGVGIWNAMIGCYAKLGRPEKAVALFEEIPSSGVQPDQITFLAASSAYGDLGSLTTCKTFHAQIDASNHNNNNDFLAASLITMYGKCGALAEAMRVFQSAISPPSETNRHRPCLECHHWSTRKTGSKQASH